MQLPEQETEKRNLARLHTETARRNHKGGPNGCRAGESRWNLVKAGWWRDWLAGVKPGEDRAKAKPGDQTGSNCRPDLAVCFCRRGVLKRFSAVRCDKSGIQRMAS